MKGLIFAGLTIYGLILARNWAKTTPKLQDGDILVQIPPIPIKTQQAGGQNLARIAFGTDIRYNKEKGYWEMILPPIVINRQQLSQLPEFIREILT